MIELKVLTAGGKSYAVDATGISTIDGLREKIIAALGLSLSGGEAGRLKLAWAGRGLTEDADVHALQTASAAVTLLAVVAPRPPPQKLRDLADGGAEEEEEALLRLDLSGAAPWQRRLAHSLRQRCHLPELVVALLFRPSWRFWAALVAWLACSKLAAMYELGPLFMVSTVFVLIASNLGTRAEGSLSAYSIFNPNLQRLPGQVIAEHLDGQMRRGQM